MDQFGVIFRQKEAKFTKVCKIVTNDKDVTLIDDTSKQIFEQTSSYSFVYNSLGNLVDQCPQEGSHRIILFSADKSLPSNREIHELCDQFARKRIPEQLEDPIPISLGVVYDDYVLDFLSLDTAPSQEFELVDTYTISEGLDLINCGFDKFHRKSEAIFVLHIGYEDFFEFIIVPRADQYVNQPSLLGLPSNQKIVGILRQVSQFTPPLIEKYCHLTKAFQLFADSFSDISTTWVATFSEGMPLKCNAALSKIITILSSDILQFQGDYRSNLFIEMDAFETSGSLSNIDMRSLGPEEQEELNYLNNNVEIFNKEQIESMESDSLLKSKRRSRLLHEEEEEMNRRRRLRSKKKSAQEIEAEKAAKALQEERRRQEEEAERQRQKQEREALKQRLDELKKTRRSRNSSPVKEQASPKTPKSTPRKNNSSFSFSPRNIASRREKAAERLAQLRAQHEDDLSYEESVDEPEPGKKELTPYQKRDKKFTELNILISKAMNASKPDSTETTENIRELSDKIKAALVEAKRFRESAPVASKELAKKLKEKKDQHNENQEIIKELRTVYLEQHNENLENKIRKQGKIRGQHVQVKIDPNPEYKMAYDFLHEEIKRVKSEIDFIKRSSKQ